MGNIFVAPIMIHKHVSVSFCLNQDSNLVPELDIPGILQTNKAKVAFNSKIKMVIFSSVFLLFTNLCGLHCSPKDEVFKAGQRSSQMLQL